MPHLSPLSGREVVKVLEKLGYRIVRRWSSHMRLVCEGRDSVTVPDYKELGSGLLRKIMRDADVFPDDFLKLLG